ncbi:uncharacterized protein F5891DRAFT_1188877 [Suillus fuscotomentosus]|uniref:Uncharacterized protein n=1 Tax=Suillus fuscotomentosus TaxID=1912939 RepID=A0AAD4HLT8_9AGAM|nr:uncharacterized protein F5891DRAFT_1188877 [Suillus fuscotomentosus]KAG1900179.1 hypothetical protein F5891DRAFT_1188877 [Suillus fuscotomentosus]
MTTPTKLRKKAPSIITQSDFLSQTAGFTNRFSMSSIAALYTSQFAEGFSNNERQASIRASLRHDAHIDGAHYWMKTAGGLHSSYISFNPAVEQTEQRVLTQDDLLEAALQDVFNAITMQDRLDGGISLLIRCGGIEAGPNISPEQVPIDLYITPRELQETGQRIGGDLAVLVQAFAQEFAVPHLHRFMQRCTAENVKPPKHFPATHISPNGPQYLPAPMVATGACIQCSAQAPHVFASALQALSDAKVPNTSSAAICHGVTSAMQHQIRQRQPADVFLSSRNPGDSLVAGQSDTLRGGTNSVGPALISVGPNTDAVLDRFKLGDEILPKLRVLASTVRSSRWESVFRSPKWDLSYEQASLLSKALLADLQDVPLNHDVVQSPSALAAVLTSILKILGILVFLCALYFFGLLFL